MAGIFGNAYVLHSLYQHARWPTGAGVAQWPGSRARRGQTTIPVGSKMMGDAASVGFGRGGVRMGDHPICICGGPRLSSLHILRRLLRNGSKSLVSQILLLLALLFVKFVVFVIRSRVHGTFLMARLEK